MTTEDERPSVSVRLDRLQAGNPDVPTFFAGLAELSADLFGDARPVSCALTLIRDDLPVTVSVSGMQTLSLDEAQDLLGDGPCLQALRKGVVVVTADLRVEARWPRYSKIVAGRGVRSVLGAPLTLPSGSQGVLNFYSSIEGRFGADEIDSARLYAAQVSACLVAAMQVTAWAITAESIKFNVDSRSVINAAVGVVMGIRNTSREIAFTHLMALADSSGGTLRTVSDDILQSLEQS